MNCKSCNILCWNVRGINSDDKWRAIHDTISSSNCDIVCLQETNREHFDHSYLRKFCPRRLDKFVYQPSVGASGGLIVIWNSSSYQGNVVFTMPYGIRVDFISQSSPDDSWKLINIYGLCQGELRTEFVNWLHDLDIGDDENWIVMGDFNFIRSTENRNLPGGDMNDILIFNEAISSAGLVELPLKGRAFTWSNMQNHPLLQQPDLVFISPSWILKYPHTELTALPNSISDHAPCVVSIATSTPKSPLFRFENFWVDVPGFYDVVQHFWGSDSSSSNPAVSLNHKLKNLRRGLKNWSKRLSNLHTIISNSKFPLLS